jgi:hypothetical protein
MALKEFKLVRKIERYETMIVEAESKEEALAKYDENIDNDGQWEEEAMLLGDDFLVAVDERDQDGEFSIQHDVENGKFV